MGSTRNDMSIQHILPENAQSAMSYGVGGLAVVASTDVSMIVSGAQVLTIVLACAVVIIRLAHDTVRFYRYLKKDKDE